jgi:small GTP-binding protein
MIHRLKTGTFTEKIGMTIGVDFQTLNLNFENKKINFQIWDLGGQERFRHIFDSYMRGARAAILLYDLTRPFTAERLANWQDIVLVQNKELPIIVIGTKYDLVDPQSAEQIKDINIFKKLNPIENIFISSKNGMNIERVFQPVFNRFQELGYFG